MLEISTVRPLKVVKGGQTAVEPCLSCRPQTAFGISRCSTTCPDGISLVLIKTYYLTRAVTFGPLRTATEMIRLEPFMNCRPRMAPGATTSFMNSPVVPTDSTHSVTLLLTSKVISMAPQSRAELTATE